jgi:hypothetical protein
MTDPMNALWQAQQDAAANFTDSWRTLLQPGADRAARPQAPAEAADADDPERLVATQPDDDADSDTKPDDDADSDTKPDEVVEPEPSLAEAFQAMQVLHDAQRDLAQHLTRVADLQRDLAEATSAWARRQRDHADALDRVLATLLAAPAERPVES